MFDSVTPTVRILTHDQQVRYARGTILIVEDHPDSREMLSLLFSSLGYTVLEANDAHEALLIVRDTDLDLIITDFGLPGVDGLELVRRVRAEGNDSHTLKIVLLTAYDRKECIGPGLQAGCDLVVGKPVDLDKFERILKLLPPDSRAQFCMSKSADQLLVAT